MPAAIYLALIAGDKLATGHIIGLFTGQHFCEHPVNTYLSGNGPGRRFIITCHHDHDQALLMHGLECLFGAFLDGVSHADDGAGLTIHRQPHGCFGLELQLIRPGLHPVQCHLFAFHQTAITYHHVVAGERSILVTAFEKQEGRYEKKVYKKVKLVALDEHMDLALLHIEEEIGISERSKKSKPYFALAYVETRAFAISGSLKAKVKSIYG